MHILFDLLITFAYLALISIGGTRAVISEMERQVVIVHGWMSHQDFVQAYGVGLLIPGPNMLFVLLIGNHVAGFLGAVASGLGMCGPTSFLLASVAWLVRRPHPPAWIRQFHMAMSPSLIGLMAASAWSLGKDIIISKDIFNAGICLLALLLSAYRLLNPSLIVILAVLIGVIKAFISG
jgi:chromate transporter